MTATLSARDLALADAIAVRLFELLEAREAARPSLVDAKTLAKHLGVDRGWVYRHADKLGALRHDGLLRFDLETATQATRCPLGEQSHANNGHNDAAAGARRRRGRGLSANGLPAPGSVLPIEPLQRRRTRRG